MSFVRLLLICLMVLALPVQGVAAATMQFCGAGHQPPASLPGSSAHAHHGAHGQAALSAADAGDDGQATDRAQPGKLKCSVCAACCMATALPASSSMLPIVKLAVDHTAVLPAAYVGPDRAGLERPPRHPLA